MAARLDKALALPPAQRPVTHPAQKRHPRGLVPLYMRRGGPRPVLERFEEKVAAEPNTGCHIWLAATHTHGHIEYGSFRSVADETPKRAHRVAWELYRGPIPDGLWVLHKCDVGLCVNPDHLFLGTMQDNTDDMLRKDRGARGERSGMAKITREQARATYMALVNGATEKALGRQLGISNHQVWCLRMGWTWAKDTADLRAAFPLPDDRRKRSRKTISWRAA